MKEAGESPPLRIIASGEDWLVPVVRGVSFNSDDEALAYSLADNKLTEVGGWDNETLAGTLNRLLSNGEEFLNGTGFTADDMASLVNDLVQSMPSDGSLLSLTDITIEDPKHVVESGQCFILGGVHVLIVADVITDWPKWVPHLKGDETLFCPYPGPFAVLSTRANDKKLVLVQPDIYIAGHILDRYSEVYGENNIKPL